MPTQYFMSKKKLLLIDLKEDKAKKIAKAINNNTCRKILELLADKDYAAGELAKKLNLPQSTIHYNISQLVEAGLVVSEEYHYSKKMKEVLHYKLANQYIVIAPSSTTESSFREKIERFLPVVLVSAIGGLAIYFYESIAGLFSRTTQDSVGIATLSEATPAMQQARSFDAVAASTEPNIAFWFLLGSFTAIIAFLIVDYVGTIRGKKK